jgi:membrane associated rhomboid family serine protease
MNHWPPRFSTYWQYFPLTTGIILANALIFIYNWIGPQPIIAFPETINSALYLAHLSHISIPHFIFNMLAFAFIAPLIEQRVSPFAFMAFFLSIWSLTISLSYPFMTSPVLGFSGILMGFLAVAVGFFYDLPELRKTLLGWLGVNIFIGLLPGISFLGHFMGALAGAITFGAWWLLGKLKVKH